MPNLVTSLALSGMWLGVASRVAIAKNKHLKEIRLRAENTITIPGSILNIIGGGLYHLISMRIF